MSSADRKNRDLKHDAKRGPPVSLRLDIATRNAIVLALRDGESRNAFILEAISREIARRKGR